MSISAMASRSDATATLAEPAFRVPAKKMAMWLFIIADTATFAGCLVAYGFTRNATPDWPRPFHSITNVALMTFIFLTSSLTMIFAIRSAQAGDKSKAFRWTMITAVLGIGFAVLHIREWFDLFDTHGERRYSAPAFSASPACTCCTLPGALWLCWRLEFATWADATRPTTLRSPDSTGTSLTWSGCSWCP
jgi:heme/copper-type cytochrome/quinol oxidase subunit 3